MCEQSFVQSLNKKGWLLFELQITQTRHSLSISDGKIVKVQHPLKNKKNIWNVQKIRGAHIQYVNNH